MTPVLDRPIVLIGPMGAGKTSIGKRVAKSLRVPFVDTDRVIVKAHGPIGELFASLGEEHFRELERVAVEEALSRRHAVVSLGGGAVLDPSTQRLLAEARVVLLTVTPEAVEARISGSDRPVLGSGGLASWRAIAEVRAPVYASLADVTFDTSHRPLTHVVDDIVTWVGTDPA